MGFFKALDAGASALTAQRLRMDTISQNIANANTTRTESGTPYKRKVVLFEENSNKLPFSQYLANASGSYSGPTGVRVAKVVEDNAPFKKVYDPGNPDANEEGYIDMPNVDVVSEMVNMISATRSYEANITALNSTKGMAMKALELGK